MRQLILLVCLLFGLIPGFTGSYPKNVRMSAWVNSISGVNWDGNQEWESYYRSLKRGFRYSLRSRRRQLTERGKLSFEVMTDHEQFPPILDWLFTHKTEWIIRTRQRSPWQDAERYKKFLITVAAEGDEFGNIMLFVLKFDDQIIAAVLARISKFTVESFIAAFDRAYGKYGPGTTSLRGHPQMGIGAASGVRLPDGGRGL